MGYNLLDLTLNQLALLYYAICDYLDNYLNSYHLEDSILNDLYKLKSFLKSIIIENGGTVYEEDIEED